MAKSYNTEAILGGAIGYIGEKPSKEELRKRFEGEAIGGSSRDVTGIQLWLDIGDISGEVFDDKRKKLIFDICKSPYESDEINKKELDKNWNLCISDFNRLIEYAQKGEEIRIWWSDAPYSACGFYYVNSVLENYDCKITAVKLPQYTVLDERTVQVFTGWNEVDAGKFYQFLPFEKPVSKAERMAIAMEWKELKSEKALLRAVVNGRLSSVPEDLYDHFIRSCIPDKEFKMARLVGEVIGRNQFGVSDWWYAGRIKKMIENNELTVVEDNVFDYEKILKKSS